MYLDDILEGKYNVKNSYTVNIPQDNFKEEVAEHDDNKILHSEFRSR